MALIELAEILLHSGRSSSFKIECDDLTDECVNSACTLLAKILPPFGSVSGVPTGGTRLEKAMLSHVTTGPVLVIDDVWTTGGSVRQHIMNMENPKLVGPIAVLFARGATPADVTVLFQLNRGLWNL